jgi:small subunit ribosomal protein S17e
MCPVYGGQPLGKVRTEMVKRIAKDLLERHPDKFTVDYEANKQVIDQIVDSRSKRLRNRISGYVTGLKKAEERNRTPTAPSTQEGAVEEMETP